MKGAVSVDTSLYKSKYLRLKAESCAALRPKPVLRPQDLPSLHRHPCKVFMLHHDRLHLRLSPILPAIAVG